MKKLKLKLKINPKYKEYLPSKNFTVFVGGGLALVLIVSLIFGLVKGKESFSALKTQDLKISVTDMFDRISQTTLS